MIRVIGLDRGPWRRYASTMHNWIASFV
jgi:hypothetical protein